MTYEKNFPIGARVVVRAGPGEGSDFLFNGKTGTVSGHGHWFRVKFDKALQGWPNPTTICQHNLRTSQRAVSGNLDILNETPP